jgi:Holliday junction resolvasome RuvABC endonuclease subunit
MRHIALDASSTTIGWVLAEDGKRRFSGTHKLKGDIQARIEQAHGFVIGLINTWQGAEVLVTEAPAVRFAKGAIPQLRVSGAIILAAKFKGVPWREVSPTEGKKALTGKGKAEKVEMLAAAAPYLGYDPTGLFYYEKSGLWRAKLDDADVFDENEADAVGVMLASLQN